MAAETLAFEAYNGRIISNIGLICSDYNAADAMTKIGHNMTLQTILRTHRITHPIEQYIVDSRLFSDIKEGK
jgi:hypothetical protein